PAAFLKVLTEKFRDSGVPWMLTGSAASSYYGEPRATNDLDIARGRFTMKKKRVEFERRRAARLFGLDVYVISPEGSILSKLEWARRGGSDRQLRDAASVLAANQETLDFEYLRRQARELSVEDLLGQLMGGAAPGGAPA
ncbi:MAG: hypothetical protein PT977_14935, partial [Acidobacteriota bacterium]|nr:hypothetical protein [Acidobacteriota bacterium]